MRIQIHKDVELEKEQVKVKLLIHPVSPKQRNMEGSVELADCRREYTKVSGLAALQMVQFSATRCSYIDIL
jgi:hypothetical protein